MSHTINFVKVDLVICTENTIILGILTEVFVLRREVYNSILCMVLLMNTSWEKSC